MSVKYAYISKGHAREFKNFEIWGYVPIFGRGHLATTNYYISFI